MNNSLIPCENRIELQRENEFMGTTSEAWHMRDALFSSDASHIKVYCLNFAHSVWKGPVREPPCFVLPIFDGVIIDGRPIFWMVDALNMQLPSVIAERTIHYGVVMDSWSFGQNQWNFLRWHAKPHPLTKNSNSYLSMQTNTRQQV